MPKMTREELQSMVKSAVNETVADAMNPLLESQKQWADEFRQQHSTSTPARKEYKDEGIGAARLVRALAAAKGDINRAAAWAERAANETWKDELGHAVVKSLQAGDLGAGGFLVQPEFASGVIEFLYNRSVVRRANPQVLPMNSGSLTLPKHTGSVAANYVGESQAIPTSEPSGGQSVMTAKKLTALVPVSNDLLRFDAGDSADRWVRNDIVRRIAVREDAAFLRDDGTENKPKGLRFWAASGNVTASNGTTSAQVEQDVRDLIDSLEQSNVSVDRVAIFMNPRSKNFLVTLREGNGGELIFPEIRGANPRIFDFPVFVTNNIPKNLGGGTNESEIYFVNMEDVIIGESGGMEIEVDASASYTEGSSLVSAFERDETLVRAITHHDFAVAHEEGVAIKTGVTWGA